MQRIRTLLVDDAGALRRLLRLALERDGTFEVVGEAADGAAGIQAAEESRPDLVILDLSMPVMDGLEALPRLVASSAHPVVVVMSGFESRRMAKQVEALGAAGYIEKGMPPSQFIDRLLDLFLRVVRSGGHKAPLRSNAARRATAAA